MGAVRILPRLKHLLTETFPNSLCQLLAHLDPAGSLLLLIQLIDLATQSVPTGYSQPGSLTFLLGWASPPPFLTE